MADLFYVEIVKRTQKETLEFFSLMTSGCLILNILFWFSRNQIFAVLAFFLTAFNIAFYIIEFKVGLFFTLQDVSLKLKHAQKFFWVVIFLNVLLALWHVLALWSLPLFGLILLVSGISLCRIKNITIPWIGDFSKRQYFKMKFKIAILRNNKYDNKIFYLSYFFICELLMAFFYYLILLFQNSEESFSTLREEIQEIYGKDVVAKIKIKDKLEYINLKQFINKLRIQEITENDISIIEKLLQRLYELHQEKKKKIGTLSLTSLSIIILTTVASGLVTSLIFPHIFKSNAATYSWVQTDWSGDLDGGATITHPDNQTGWTKYSAKEAKVKTSVSGEVGLENVATTTVQTSYVDFSGGTASQTHIVDQGSGAGKVKLGCVGGGVDSTCFNKAITINNTSNGNTLTDYQVLVTMDTASLIADGKMKPDCSDIRFTDTDQVTKRSYWLESGCNTATTRFWVKIPSIPASSNMTVYVYYGNTSLVSESNGPSTFVKFDDFSTNLDQWTQHAGWGTIATSSGKLFLSVAGGVLSDWANAPFVYTATPTADYVATVKLESYAVNADTMSGIMLYDNSSNVIRAGRYQNNGPGPTRSKYEANRFYNGAYVDACGSYNSTTMPGLLRIRKLGASRYFDVSVNAGTSWNQMYSTSTDAYIKGKYIGLFAQNWWAGYKSPIAAPFVNFNVRAYSSPEPSTSLGAESTANYNPSGTFTSSIMDTGGFATWKTMTWTDAIPAGTSVSMKVRTCDDALCAGETAFSSIGDTVTKGMDISSLSAVADGRRYIQYQFTLSANGAHSLSSDVQDVTINYDYTGTLTSTSYNTSDSSNVFSQFSWQETATGNNNIQFQLRTGSAYANLSAASWLGPDGTGNTYFDDSSQGCAKNGSTVTCSISNLVSLGDGLNDQWVQYKAYLTTTKPLDLPTLAEVNLQYVVNARPEFEASPSAAQDSSGQVNISYSVRDADTAQVGAACPNCVTPSFQYSLDNGATWQDITTGLSQGATSPQTIAEVNYTSHELAWNAKAQIDGTYAASAKIKVIVNDGEGANMIASSTSAAFALDVKNPVPGNPAVKVIASTTPASLVISAADNNVMQMKISLDSGLSGASWQNYAAGSNISLASDPDIVYVQFRDAYNNTSAIQSSVTPETPEKMVIRDLSNVNTADYKMFITWKTVANPGPGFSAYHLWYSTDGENYSHLAELSPRTANYYIHSGLIENATCYYKVATKDSAGNVSYYSEVVNDKADGQGGTDQTAPIISTVASSDITTTQATITWNTDEISSSTVMYMAQAGGDFSHAQRKTESGVKDNASGLGQHQVILAGLTPGRSYYYKVESSDIFGNTASSTQGVDGYTFETLPGAVISNVTTSEINNKSAIVTWNTDIESNSYVIYSLNSTPTGSPVGNATLTKSHSVVLSGLTQGTKYYYYVQSTDASAHMATDNNGGEYYTFATTLDTTPPVITFNPLSGTSDITASSSIIMWNTDEAATSTIRYGLTRNSYTWQAKNDNFNINHAVRLSNLNGSSTYYFEIINSDASNNTAIDNNSGADYTFTTLDSSGPAISLVATADTSVTSAQITWTTNELASSFVQYAASITDFDANFVEKGKKNAVLTHSVDLTGLGQHQTYYYRIRSADTSGNQTIDDKNGDYYSFITMNGPVVTNVSATPSETAAIISWTTNILADGYAIYDTHADFSASKEQGTSDKTSKDHAVTITGLSPGTKYYYKVRSTDAKSGATIEDNDYNFTTASDITPPAIDNIEANPIYDTVAVIKWTTSETARSKVEYGLTSGSYNESMENTNLDLTHAITLTGLTAKTKYYYHVISKDANNNTATSTEQNFTTLETLSTETQVQAREAAAKGQGKEQGIAEQKANTTGGGILIIDKTDKVAPKISTVTTQGIGSDSASVSWATDEPANGFVEYGEDTGYGKILGHYLTTLSHAITLDNLKPETTYHYRIADMDTSGNLAQSQDITFTTLAKGEEEIKNEEGKKQEEKKEEVEQKQEKLFKDIEALSAPESGLSKEEIFISAAAAAQKAMDVLKSVSAQVSITTAEEKISKQVENWKTLGEIVPSPLLSGEPRVITTATTAIIAWKTDKESNSLVAIASESAYKIAEDKENPYLEVRGNPQDKTTEHVVTVYDLEPETVYHYQIRSQGEIGPMAKSSDFTFKTKNETLEISNYAVQNVSNEKAIFKWVTNLETDSQVNFIPYRDNKLMVEESKKVSDKAMSIIHEVEVESFEAGVTYNIELSGKDMKGQAVTKEIPIFSTSKDDLPPIIYQVQTESAISPGKEEKIQTIISWLTNELSTSRVYYAKGIAQKDEDFTEKTVLDNNFSKKHVVIITKFDPGAVYSFKVESLDSGGNISMSKIYTILTPRQKESVFQVIMKNLEQTFGWMSKIKQ